MNDLAPDLKEEMLVEMFRKTLLWSKLLRETAKWSKTLKEKDLENPLE